MFDSLRLTVTLLVALHAHGASAANDIDETVAIVVFAILIAVFSGISILFAFLILRIKHRDWQAARSDGYNAPGHLEKSKRDILRINSDHGITGFHSTGSDVAAYNGKTPGGFSAASVYVNPGFSSDIIGAGLDTTSTFQQQPEKEKTEVEPLQRQDSAAPNFGNTENASGDIATVVLNENFVDKDSPVTETHPETDNVPAVDENSDTKSTSTDEISAPVDNDSDNSNEKTSSNSDVFANDITEDGMTPTSALESHQDPKPSHPVSKKKSPGVLLKRHGSHDSQKPLLYSQSSTTSSLSSVTVDSNGVGGQTPSSLLPNAFNESDEQQENEESKL